MESFTFDEVEEQIDDDFIPNWEDLAVKDEELLSDDEIINENDIEKFYTDDINDDASDPDFFNPYDTNEVINAELVENDPINSNEYQSEYNSTENINLTESNEKRNTVDVDAYCFLLKKGY